MSLIQISNSQLQGFIAIATCCYGNEIGKLAAYRKYGDKKEDCQFERMAMVGPMLKAINYIVPEMRSTVSFSIPVNPALILATFTVTGYGVIATSAWMGSRTATALNLANQINLGGVFHATATNEFVVVEGPVGLGTPFNSTAANITFTYPAVVSVNLTFAGGLTATTTCLTYDQVFSIMQFISKRLGFCFDLNQTPALN